MDPEASTNSEEESKFPKTLPPEFIEEYEKNVELSNNLLARGIDFVKWTTTISIGAIIWIASSPNDNKYLFSSLVFFIFAIAIAIYIVFYVFTYWTRQVKSHKKFMKLFLSDEGEYQKSIDLTHPKTLYNIFDYRESRIKELKFRDPDAFMGLILIHLILILGGLSLYLRSFF